MTACKRRLNLLAWAACLLAWALATLVERWLADPCAIDRDPRVWSSGA